MTTSRKFAMKRLPLLLFATVCGIILVCAVTVVSFFPEIGQIFSQHQTLETQRRTLSARWEAPEDNISPEAFFPRTVAYHKLSSHDTNASIPRFQLEIPGWHAHYGAPESQVDVFVYRRTDAQREVLFDQIRKREDEEKDIFNDDADHHSDERAQVLLYSDAHLYHKTFGGTKHHLWWIKGWLLVFHTTDPEDREPFIWAFLSTTSKQNEPQADEEKP